MDFPVFSRTLIDVGCGECLVGSWEFIRGETNTSSKG